MNSNAAHWIVLIPSLSKNADAHDSNICFNSPFLLPHASR
jgi:hypothetical protein